MTHPLEDAKRRLEVRIDRASHVGAVAIDAADVLAVMRELGRLAALADEATRAENEACAELMEHLGDNELAAAIRARLSAIAPKDKP